MTNPKRGTSPTKKQLAVAQYMRDYLAANDNMPTLKQMAEHFNVAQNSILGHLHGLERYKIIERSENINQFRFFRGGKCGI